MSIEAHTDALGDESFNMALSQSRAQSVAKYLVQRGVRSEQLQSQGYGEANPIADNNTAQGRAANRRVALRVVEGLQCD